jgi:endonuclease-8
MEFESGRVLHTHMRMTGAWHVYPAGERWRRPGREARLVLEADDRVAVCFNAPVVELLAPRMAAVHPALRRLGADILDPDLDVAAVVDRAAALPGETEVGDVLLDQSVVAGIGNIYRCEALFLTRTNPRAPISSVRTLAEAVSVAASLMRASADGHRTAPWVYGRTRRPCRRCRAMIVAARTGHHARTAYWCPRCQPDGESA